MSTTAPTTFHIVDVRFDDEGRPYPVHEADDALDYEYLAERLEELRADCRFLQADIESVTTEEQLRFPTADFYLLEKEWSELVAQYRLHERKPTELQLFTDEMVALWDRVYTAHKHGIY
jgi:hypothetical protein